MDEPVERDFEQVAVTPANGAWGATTRSYEGTCFYARLETGVATYGVGSVVAPSCHPVDALAVSDPTW